MIGAYRGRGHGSRTGVSGGGSSVWGRLPPPQNAMKVTRLTVRGTGRPLHAELAVQTLGKGSLLLLLGGDMCHRLDW